MEALSVASHLIRSLSSSAGESPFGSLVQARSRADLAVARRHLRQVEECLEP